MLVVGLNIERLPESAEGKAFLSLGEITSRSFFRVRHGNSCVPLCYPRRAAVGVSNHALHNHDRPLAVRVAGAILVSSLPEEHGVLARPGKASVVVIK